jgi:hypothetical protein
MTLKKCKTHNQTVNHAAPYIYTEFIAKTQHAKCIAADVKFPQFTFKLQRISRRTESHFPDREKSMWMVAESA